MAGKVWTQSHFPQLISGRYPVWAHSVNAKWQLTGFAEKCKAWKQVRHEYVFKLLSDLYGIPYFYGGNTPAQGLDCSGLTILLRQHLLPALGLLPPLQRPMERRAIGQATQSGYAVVPSLDAVQLGDLFCYRYRGTPCHVTLALGPYYPGFIIGANGGGSSVRGNKESAHVKIERFDYWRGDGQSSGFFQVVRPV